MKITIYTITDCPFCTKEKEYFTSKNIAFEEKNVKEKREFLTELLEVSNKFAGVPFTVIEKDSGEKVMIKGFTQSEFDAALSGDESPIGAGLGADAGAQASPDDLGGKSEEKPFGVTAEPAVAAAPGELDEEQAKAQKNLDSIMGDLQTKGTDGLGKEPVVDTVSMDGSASSASSVPDMSLAGSSAQTTPPVSPAAPAIPPVSPAAPPISMGDSVGEPAVTMPTIPTPLADGGLGTESAPMGGGMSGDAGSTAGASSADQPAPEIPDFKAE